MNVRGRKKGERKGKHDSFSYERRRKRKREEEREGKKIRELLEDEYFSLLHKLGREKKKEG